MPKMRVLLLFSLILLVLIAGTVIFFSSHSSTSKTPAVLLPHNVQQVESPLSIERMRTNNYPGSALQIEQTLTDGAYYHQYITSYTSEGLTIHALLTVPIGAMPQGGWPVIVFNHGYIEPQTYQTYPTIGQYASYYPVFSSHGYIVLKPDYRGNGTSDGSPQGAYYSPDYTIDDLNAIASITRYKDANPHKIGVWGHSMGGNITLRDLVTRPQEIQAAVIWGGVVGNYTDLEHWHDPSYHPSAQDLALRNQYRQNLYVKHGTPEQNPGFWDTIDPTFYLSDIAAPIQLHVGGADEEVPATFSAELYHKLQAAGKTVEFYSYPDDNHNISQNFTLAMQRSLSFFDRYLK